MASPNRLEGQGSSAPQEAGKARRRIMFAVAALAVFVAEAAIAVFFHDDFVRPYLGDVLVVVLVYLVVRIVLPCGCRLLPLWVFLFAFVVELTQAADLVGALGLSGVPGIRLVAGGVFDWADVGCYAAGCVLCALVQEAAARNRR